MLKSCLGTLNKENDLTLPKVVDLFSGCGGLAYGFKSAGFEISHGVELLQSAVRSASYNLYWAEGKESAHLSADITEIGPEDLGCGICDEGWIIIGGPPCQAYSKAGRAKLRSLGEDRIHTNDSRGFLYQDFLRFALELNARAILMENVPDATNYGGLNVPQHVCEILEANGYQACWTILNAADYGVPQIRERVFVFALKSENEFQIDLPKPTHRNPTCNNKYNPKTFEKYISNKNFRLPKTPDDAAKPWVTVEEALSDLPTLFPAATSKFTSIGLNITMQYQNEPDNDYQRLMRSWKGETDNQVTGHAFRKTARDFQIFDRMPVGSDYREASRIADQLLIEECKRYYINQYDNPNEYALLKKKIVPPYDRKKFFGKWRRLNPNNPSHTLVAHLDTDTYSHIHPWEPRGISVREAARLQSFPDNFIFQGTMGEAFRQIGNAVPPLLAKAVAEAMKANIARGGTME